MTEQPFVSIVVPCYNEEATIRKLLEALLAQTYPLANMEVIIADGISADGTRAAIAEFQRERNDLAIRVIENRTRSIPSGVNQAIRESRGEIIVRLDAHSIPIPEYVARCVAAHQSGKGDNVGGVWDIQPGAKTQVAKSIAYAAAHPLGVGDALYRLNAQAGAVDTVPFGSFRRELIERIGAFDESLLANEDYEFNARVRQAGGRVWLDPSIRSVYFARETFQKLARQYWRYGFWKFKMLKRYPRTLRWRQALPPLFVLVLLILFLSSFIAPIARYALALQLAVYFFAVESAAIILALKTKKSFLLWGLPFAIAIMHISWGVGFLWSGVISPFKND